MRRELFPSLEHSNRNDRDSRRCAAHTAVLPGHEVAAIVEFAEKHHFDLLVIGFVGHSQTFGQTWGSASRTLTELSPCNVLVVK
jgi:nucleotide-binding universal stress UspA family protein